MKLVFVNVMPELQRFDSIGYITQPPVPLAVLNAATPKTIETGLLDEQAEPVIFDGDVFAFSLSTENASAVYRHADALHAVGKTIILGGIHATVCPDEAGRHADAVVTGEAETIWPLVCEDLLAGRLRERYEGSPTVPSRMVAVDYGFFGRRRYLTPASLFATRGCNRRCAFCVSSRYMGPYRVKPLDVLEQEIDQLGRLFPNSFLQFTDDNLLASEAYRRDLMVLLRRRKRRFVTMVTVDQFCDAALVDELAASGCLGVAVGVESVDDDNCASMDKYQNLQKPFADAVAYARRRGVHTAALIMLGLPHDTPARLAHALEVLRHTRCAVCDVRILRIYPGTPLYARLVLSGDVPEGWWLTQRSDGTFNAMLPSCLAANFTHPSFPPMDLQRAALRFIAELNRMEAAAIAGILRVGARARNLGFAGTMVSVRRSLANQARALQRRVHEVTGDGSRHCGGAVSLLVQTGTRRKGRRDRTIRPPQCRPGRRP